MGAPALKHCQLPLPTILFETQNVQIAVVAFDLEVAIVSSIPLIDGFDDFDLAPTEPKAHWHFEPEMAGATPDLYLHGYSLPRRGRAIRIFLFDLCRVVPSCRLGARAVAVETTDALAGADHAGILGSRIIDDVSAAVPCQRGYGSDEQMFGEK
jgi:hypothetical protein